MRIFAYNRLAAVSYARRWALERNPMYYDFDEIGGDCTNFASQCIYAGARVMNYEPTYGWYYISPDDRSPSWHRKCWRNSVRLWDKVTGND